MAHIVDLRSDTVTKPSEAMKHAMVNSALGDDVFREDPTVNALEQKLAATLGKQAALFVPSGTMSNLIAIMVHCNKRGSEALVGNKSHIFKYEQGGAAHLGGVLLSTLPNKPDGTFALEEFEDHIRGEDIHEPVTSLVAVENTHNACGGAAHLGGVLLSTLPNKPDGTFALEEFEDHIRGEDIHEPVTSLVAVENTHNACGGKVLPLSWLDDLTARAKKHSIPVHMDGARLFNACTYLQEPPSRVVRDCESVSVCFSKGLGAPVGSALVGSVHFIEQARRVRKMLGGGMRQGGVLAAAAIVALDEVVSKLVLDHKRAQVLAKTIKSLQLKNFNIDLENVHTNIVLLKLSPSFSIPAEKVINRLAQVCLKETQGDCKTEEGEGVIVKAIYFDDKTIRFTLHCDIDDQDLWLAIMKISYVLKEFEGSYK